MLHFREIIEVYCNQDRSVQFGAALIAIGLSLSSHRKKWHFRVMLWRKASRLSRVCICFMAQMWMVNFQKWSTWRHHCQRKRCHQAVNIFEQKQIEFSFSCICNSSFNASHSVLKAWEKLRVFKTFSFFPTKVSSFCHLLWFVARSICRAAVFCFRVRDIKLLNSFSVQASISPSCSWKRTEPKKCQNSDSVYFRQI